MGISKWLGAEMSEIVEPADWYEPWQSAYAHAQLSEHRPNSMVLVVEDVDRHRDVLAVV